MRFLIAFSAVCLFAGSQAGPAPANSAYESQLATLKSNVEKAVQGVEQVRTDAKSKLSSIENNHKIKVADARQQFNSLLDFYVKTGNQASKQCTQRLRENYKEMDDAISIGFRKCFDAGVKSIDEVQREYSKASSVAADAKKRFDGISKKCGSLAGDKAKSCYTKESSSVEKILKEFNEKLNQVKEKRGNPVYKKVQSDAEICYSAASKTHAFMSSDMVKMAEKCKA